MTQRWPILILLFTVRLSMAFQFQSVASLSPAMMAQYGVGLGDIGLLIGLYLAPGLAFALPGGEIGRRFGDKRVILVGLALMIAGGVIAAVAPTWLWQIAGRLVAGIGGVLLNVLMSKMVTDRFEGREMATAMAIFVTSWPVGIALCLFAVPAIAAAHGVTAAVLLSTGFCGLGFALLAALYRPLPHSAGASAAPAIWPDRLAMLAVVVVGSIWGLFNAALGMVFGFGISMLVGHGWSPAAAGFATSLVLWTLSVSVPLGGALADRTGKPVALMLTGFALFAITLAIATRTDAVIVAFVAMGLVCGLSAGPVMSLPSRVLGPQSRAVGMGIYFTLYYLMVVAAPIAAGMLASRTGTAEATFDFGAVMMVICIPAYWLFERLATRATLTGVADMPLSSPRP